MSLGNMLPSAAPIRFCVPRPPTTIATKRIAAMPDSPCDDRQGQASADGRGFFSFYVPLNTWRAAWHPYFSAGIFCRSEGGCFMEDLHGFKDASAPLAAAGYPRECMGTKKRAIQTYDIQPLRDRVRLLRLSQKRLLRAIQQSIDETKQLLGRVGNDRHN